MLLALFVLCRDGRNLICIRAIHRYEQHLRDPTPNFPVAALLGGFLLSLFEFLTANQVHLHAASNRSTGVLTTASLMERFSYQDISQSGEKEEKEKKKRKRKKEKRKKTRVKKRKMKNEITSALGLEPRRANPIDIRIRVYRLNHSAILTNDVKATLS